MRVFVVGGDKAVAAMFEAKGHTVVDNATETTCDLLVFTGGADVSPFLYGERPHKNTNFDINRDIRDLYFWKTFHPQFPKIGICRGAQFGNVLCGGKLWQDVDGHAGQPHLIRDIASRTPKNEYTYIRVPSTHHQMAVLSPDALLLATANQSSRKESAREINRSVQPFTDPEAFYYYNFNFLGVQFHPEYPGYAKCTQYFWELVNHFPEPFLKNTKHRMVAQLS